MERYEMAELLSQKAGVTLEEARQALADNNWDLLDAMVALERAHRPAPSAVDIGADAGDGAEEDVKPVKNVSSRDGAGVFTNGFAVLWGYVKKLFRISLDNDFVVLHHDKQILAVPVLVLVVLLFASFGLMLVVLLAGLFLDCKYHFAGRQLGQEGINAAMDKVSDLAGDIKQSIRNAGEDKPDDQ